MEREAGVERPSYSRHRQDELVYVSEGVRVRNDADANGIKPAARNNHTTAVVGDKIFFHGGHDGSQWLDDLFILNTQHSTWTKPNIASSCVSW